MSRVKQVRFNRNFSCFTTCGNDGFRVFNIDPLMQIYHATPQLIGSGMILMADMLRRSSLVALVGANSDCSVILWDCSTNKARRLVHFHQKVVNIKFLHDKLIVVLLSKIHILSFAPQVKTLCTFDTRDNRTGILSINSGSSAQVMAFPGLEKAGTIQVTDLQQAGTHRGVAPTTLTLHQHEIACVALNSDGSRLASASEHGTLIRLFDVARNQKLLELRRGNNTALVYSLNFSLDSRFLCVASDKGTVHVFGVTDSSLNRRSALPSVGLPSLKTHTDSQWAAAKFTVPAEMACVCSFLRDKRSTIVVICVDGSYHKYRFTPDPTGCTAEAFERYLDLGDSMEM